jgi:hypothetical protein
MARTSKSIQTKAAQKAGCEKDLVTSFTKRALGQAGRAAWLPLKKETKLKPDAAL